MSEKKNKCNCCGKCCWFLNDDKKFVPCIYLSNNKCSVYKKLFTTKGKKNFKKFVIEVIDGKPVFCIGREKSLFNFPGCAYNEPGKPMIQFEKMKRKYKQRRIN